MKSTTPEHTMSLTAALAAYTTDLATVAAASARALHARMVAAHGPALGTIGRDFTYAETFSRTIRPVCTYVDGCPVIDEAALTAWAAAWAAAQIEELGGKIEAKMAGLLNLEVLAATKGLITVAGTTPGGRRVCLDQRRILNVSSKGNLYNQWPAVLHLDGDKISEADLRAFLATERPAPVNEAARAKMRRALDAAKARAAV